MQLTRPRALVVEDDPVTRGFVSEVLSDTGYDVFTCEDGSSALGSFMRNAPFSLLVVDILLPGMRGTEVVDLLCRASADLRVLFISARATAPVLGPGRRFLSKPFGRSALLDEVRRLSEP